MEKGLVFFRWGNLNPVKHKEARGAADDEWYHVAPVYKGIYAFPQGYIEPFLIGGSYGEHHRRLLKDKGKMITQKEFYNESFTEIKPYYKKLMRKLHIKERDIYPMVIDDNVYIGYNERPKRFIYNGDIWHHLTYGVKESEIIDSKHGWIKTSFRTYIESLNRRTVMERFFSYMKDGKNHGNPHTHPMHFSKDVFEVFIEHVK